MYLTIEDKDVDKAISSDVAQLEISKQVVFSPYSVNFTNMWLIVALLLESNKLLLLQNNNLLADKKELQSNQSSMMELVNSSTAEIICSSKADAVGIIALLRSDLAELSAKAEEQTKLIRVLEEEASARREAASQLRARKERFQNRQKKCRRAAATFPEFLESIKIINSKSYKSEFVRSREKVSLLLLFLTGIRVSNLCEITASDLQCLLTEEESVYFQVNAIKSKKHTVYGTWLTSISLSLVQEYKADILRILQDKEPGDYVFTSKSSNFSLDRSSLTKSLNKILKPAGKVFGKTISSHSFRIGHITALIAQFGLFHAQHLIGHENAETTLRYARDKFETKELTTRMYKVEELKYKKMSRYKNVKSND